MHRTVRLVVSAGVVAGLAAAASAQVRPTGPISARHFGDSQSLRGPGNYATGFETVEGFTVGPIEPQLGWTASGTNLAFASVDVANPFTGSQHLRVVNDTTVGAGTQRVILGPNLGALPAGSSSTSVDINLSNDGGADVDVVGQAPSQGFLTWRVKFSFSDAAGTGPGTIFVLDDTDPLTPGAQLGFVDTGVIWAEALYRNLRVDTDPGTNSIAYFYDNVQIYSSAGGIFAGTTVEQFVIVTDNFQLAGETADFDNLSIIPAPGAVALLGLGLATASRRRRA